MPTDVDELIAAADQALEQSSPRAPTREEIMAELREAIEHLRQMPPGTPRHSIAVDWVTSLRAKLEATTSEPPALALVPGGRDDA